MGANYIIECPWCWHTGLGHTREIEGSTQATQVCQVPIRVDLGSGNIMMVPCGCNKTGPKKERPDAPPLPPPPTCLVCGEFSAPGSSFCSETCEARAKRALRGEPEPVPPPDDNMAEVIALPMRTDDA